jgi:hypothetical protein
MKQEAAGEDPERLQMQGGRKLCHLGTVDGAAWHVSVQLSAGGDHGNVLQAPLCLPCAPGYRGRRMGDQITGQSRDTQTSRTMTLVDAIRAVVCSGPIFDVSRRGWHRLSSARARRSERSTAVEDGEGRMKKQAAVAQRARKGKKQRPGVSGSFLFGRDR